MVAAEVGGMVAIFLAGCLDAVVNAASAEAERFGLPFFYLWGLGSVSAGLALVPVCLMRGSLSRMDAHRWKWVLLRGAFGTLALMAQLAAIALGAPLGDTSALLCINVVLSALMGRAFLGEPLRALHVLALCLSLSGAVLVSQPEFLFGGAGGGTPLAGYAMALASGVLSGCTFIAARKAQDVDPVVLTTCVDVFVGLSCFVMPQIGLASGLPVRNLLERPLLTAVSIPLVGLITVAVVGGLSIGSQFCPAVASSTVYSASSMALGYVFEIAMQGGAPQAATISGALMMLLAVAVMALARWLYSPRATAPPDAAPPACGEEAAKDDAGSQASSVSLAHFVASEWSGVSASPLPSGLRQRSAAGGVPPPVAVTLGLASA